MRDGKIEDRNMKMLIALIALVVALSTSADTRHYKDPWRVIDGVTYKVSEDSGWVVFFAHVVSVHPKGVMVLGTYEGTFGEEREFFLEGFPYSVAEVDFFLVGKDNALWAAKPSGTYTYTTAIGGSRTV